MLAHAGEALAHTAVAGCRVWPPFGTDLAVLVYNTALEGASLWPPNSLAKTAAMARASASEAIEASTELQHERPELKILTWGP